MEEEKTVKTQKEEEKEKFVKRIVEFINTKKPKKTSDFVKAGLFKNRNQARKVLRALAEKGIVRMERGKNKRYLYDVPRR